MVDHSRATDDGRATVNGDTNDQEAPVAWLRWLERLPRIAVFLSVLVISLGFLFTPGVPGAILVLLLAAASAFLVYATWPKYAVTARFARVLPVLALTALGVAKFFIS